MGLFPELTLGWLNGWIAIALLALVDGTLFLIFPRPVVKRLWDRSGRSPKQTVFTVLGKLVAAGGLILIVFTPLKNRIRGVFLRGGARPGRPGGRGESGESYRRYMRQVPRHFLFI